MSGSIQVPTEFSTIFWNIWTDNQTDTAKLAALCQRFGDLNATHAPDAFGLNEVLIDKRTGRSIVLDHLESLGYKTYFAAFSPVGLYHICGSALACKRTISDIQFLELGPDTAAALRGHPGHSVKLIQANLSLGGKVAVNMVVNYLAHVVPYNIVSHVKHHKAFRLIAAAPRLQMNTIIGGDFNQFRFIPKLWGADKLYNRITGTLLNPTWKWLGKIPGIQANYDNIFWTKSGMLQLKDFAILPRIPSDHAPLFARFSLEPRQQL